LISVKKNNPYDEVALVCNCKIKDNYMDILSKNGIKFLYCEYDSFRQKKTTRYSLAYYKLCSFLYIVHEFEYDNIMQLDCDTYCMKNFDMIWKECYHHIMALQIPYSLNSSQKYFYDEYHDFTNIFDFPQYFGSEFICANRVMAKKLINECLVVDENMKKKNFSSKAGDEFIWNVAFTKMGFDYIKNASPYIMRVFSARPYFYNLSFESMLILHLPLEKETGLLKCYSHYDRCNKLYTNNKTYKIFGMKHFHRPIYSYSFKYFKIQFNKIRNRNKKNKNGK
jgi:hypothetical protein